MRINFMAGLVAIVSMAAPALADDWVAVKQRGTVLVLVDGAWEKLSRGDVVSDERIVRTLRGGRLTLQRGGEIIDLGADTQVRIFDRAGRQFTTVLQDFGTVSVEADIRDVQHFAVKTPHLAAVVKGTRFTVRSDANSAEVEVERGRVAVTDSDTQQATTVTAGQSVTTSDTTPLEVRGDGELPMVVGENGKAVVGAGEDSATGRDAAKEAKEASREAAKEASREAAKEAREGRSDDRPSGNGGNGNSGSNSSGGGNGNSDNGNGNSGSNNSGGGNSGSNNSGNGKKNKG